MIRRWASFFLAALILLGASRAQAAETQSLTLEQALAIAADRNRDIQKAREYRNWVEGKYVEERAAAFGLPGETEKSVEEPGGDGFQEAIGIREAGARARLYHRGQQVELIRDLLDEMFAGQAHGGR